MTDHNDSSTLAETASTPPAPVAAPAAPEANIQHWLTQARNWRQRGNPGEALALCRRILAIQPRHTEALNILGMLLLQQGQPALAEQTIRQAMQSALNDATAYANLGAALTAQSRHEEAMTAFSHALRLRADDVDTHIRLGDPSLAVQQLRQQQDGLTVIGVGLVRDFEGDNRLLMLAQFRQRRA